MPQLNKKMAKEVEKSESSFTVVPDGIYIAKLLKVTDSGKAGPSGANYWNWEFVLEDNPEHNGSHQFLTTSLSEKALFKLQETFAAFGVAPDTDTDELISKKVRLNIGHKTAQGGQRAGEIVNDLKRVLPLEDGATEVDPDEIPF